MFSFGKVPKSSYRLWVGEPLEKFSLLQGIEDKCMGKVLAFKEGEAIGITWYGNTEETRAVRECGVNAVRDISGKVNVVNNCALDGFGKIIDMLDSFGYTNGVNYQAIPYDFRDSVK